MVKCDKCDGKGYREESFIKFACIPEEEEFVEVKVWCTNCKGIGKVSYSGDRTGVGWERE